MFTHNQVIYHRGRHGIDGVKENSLEAMRRAVSEGAHMIEFDVFDGLRIAHDPLHLTPDTPTLREVLDVINGACAVNIEIKSPRMAVDVFATIKDAWRGGAWKAEQFIISSFHHKTAAYFKAWTPSFKVGAIFDAVPSPTYIAELKNMGIDNLHIEWMNVLMDKEGGYELLNAAQALRMSIWVWTVNDLSTAQIVENYGAERIFTDRPELFP